MIEPIGTPPVCAEVVVTAENVDWLAGFTRALVEDRLAACADSIDPVRTTLRRDGKVVDVSRARTILHTRAALVPEIIDRVGRDDPEEIPGLVARRLLDGHPAYLRWIERETDGAAHLVHAR